MNKALADSLVLAVDGGQTHSVALVANVHGCVIGAGKGGPANHFNEPGGPERFMYSMRQCILGALGVEGSDIPVFDAAHYCLTGVHHVMPVILHEIAPSYKQVVAGDKEASLTGGTLERPAVLVLAGTGAIAYGLTTDGRQCTTGGWGYAMGDEGSAAWITPRGLSAATQAEDGRGALTLLTAMIPQHYNVASLRELHPLIYNQRIDRVKLAEISSVVGKAAALGDEVACKIIYEAAQHLGNAACAVIKQLELAHSPITITSAGGVFKAGELLIQPVMSRIHQDAPLADYRTPRYPPVVGALILALQSLEIPVTHDILANIDASAHIWNNLK